MHLSNPVTGGFFQEMFALQFRKKPDFSDLSHVLQTCLHVKECVRDKTAGRKSTWNTDFSLNKLLTNLFPLLNVLNLDSTVLM